MGKWFWIIAALLLIVPGCGNNDTPTRPNTFTPLTSIVITADLNTLVTGTSTRLIATGNYSGLFTRDITNQVDWTSSDTNIDLLSRPGRIKALIAGDATITATLDGLTANSLNLKVSTATISTVSVSPQLPSLPQGLSRSFTAQGSFSDNTTQDLTFDVVWSSSDETVATISTDVASIGLATALNIGTSTITALFLGESASTLLTVNPPIPLSIEVSPASLSLLNLSTQSFTATGRYSDGSTLDITTKASWASSNPSAAAITAGGNVKAEASGVSTISATIEGMSGTANLKVTGGKLTGITLALAQNEQKKGTMSRVTARGTFDNGTSRDITGVIETWTVEDPLKANVISVTGENLAWVNALAVTPLATPTKLSASYGTVPVFGESSLTVTDPTLSSVQIPEQAITLTSGTSTQLSLTGVFTPTSNQNLAPSATWTSDTPATATVGDLGLGKGRVHAKAAGTSVITATYDGIDGKTATTTTTITVDERTLQSLTLTPVADSGAIIAGRQIRFTLTATYTTGFTQDVTADATWSIADSNVAIFSDLLTAPGLVVAVDVGTTTVTAKFDGMEATLNVVVSQ